MTGKKSKVIHAFGWKLAEKAGVQGANFLLTLILARLLDPSDYGLIALIVVFTSIAGTFVQGGFSTALIQKKDPAGTDYVSVLLVSGVVAAALYGILWLAAPAIADFYQIPLLEKVMRIMALILFPSAISSVQTAYLTRDLRFRVLGICNLIAVVAAAGLGILLASRGYGVWALVAQQLSTQLILCAVMLIATRWVPRGRFSVKSVKKLIPFGSRVLCQNLMVQIFLNIRSLIIGRVYTTADLGYFNRGKTFPQTVMETVNGTVQTVLLPVYAKEQDDREKVVTMLRKTIRLTGFLVFPMLVGLACVGRPLVKLTLTERWLPCVPFLQIFALSYLFHPIQISSAQAYKAIGDSRTPLHIEIIRKLIEFTLLMISIRYGVLAIAFSSLVNGFLGMCVTFYPNARKLRYSLRQQLSDLLPAMLITILMGILVLTAQSLLQNLALQLVVGILVGVCSYILFAKLFRVQALDMMLSIVKGLKK